MSESQAPLPLQNAWNFFCAGGTLRVCAHQLWVVLALPSHLDFRTPFSLFIFWVVSAATGRAITHDAMVFHDGELAGLQLAAAFVDNNAPEWLTNYAQKSDVEFELLAMEGEYTLGNFGRIENGLGYSSGVSAGIQEYIDQMNSIGQPVWFTDSADPTGVSSPAPNISVFNPPRLEREDWYRGSTNPRL